MAYAITTLVIINSPDDYLSWTPRQKVMRWRAVMKWHEYVAQLHAAGKLPWSWGSHQLIRKFRDSPIVSTHVAIYHCDGMEEFTTLLERDPLREYSSYVTVPLRSLERDYLDEVQNRDWAKPLPSDPASRMAQQSARALFATRPPELEETTQGFIAPANLPAPPDARASDRYRISYLLVGHAPQAGMTISDLQRNVETEKVRWWHTYNSKLVESGSVTHGWASGVLCHPGNPVSNQKGAAVVIDAETPEELDELVNLNPLGEQSELLSVVLRPLGDQKEADGRRLQMAEAELQVELELQNGK